MHDTLVRQEERETQKSGRGNIADVECSSAITQTNIYQSDSKVHKMS